MAAGSVEVGLLDRGGLDLLQCERAEHVHQLGNLHALGFSRQGALAQHLPVLVKVAGVFREGELAPRVVELRLQFPAVFRDRRVGILGRAVHYARGRAQVLPGLGILAEAYPYAPLFGPDSLFLPAPDLDHHSSPPRSVKRCDAGR